MIDGFFITLPTSRNSINNDGMVIESDGTMMATILHTKRLLGCFLPFVLWLGVWRNFRASTQIRTYDVLLLDPSFAAPMLNQDAASMQKQRHLDSRIEKVPAPARTVRLSNSSLSLNDDLIWDAGVEQRYDPRICQYFQFDVSGMAKCGTTTMARWLSSHPEVIMPFREMHWMIYKKAVKAAKEIQLHLNKATKAEQNKTNPIIADTSNKVTGYRFPHDLQYKQVRNFYTNTCPQTKHIVMLRNPLLHFESIYNYRLKMGETTLIKSKSVNKLQGKTCNFDPALVCLDNGAFHKDLAKLGKTPLTDDAEWDLIHDFRDEVRMSRNGTSSTAHRVPNPIFLVEMTQLLPDPTNNTSWHTIFRQDVQHYFGLKEPMPPIPHENQQANIAQRSAKSEKKSKKTRKAKKTTPSSSFHAIDICDKKYSKIHGALLEVATNASSWIRNYFIQSPEVFVSSEDHFHSLLEQWSIDPCIERRRHVASEQ